MSKTTQRVQVQHGGMMIVLRQNLHLLIRIGETLLNVNKIMSIEDLLDNYIGGE